MSTKIQITSLLMILCCALAAQSIDKYSQSPSNVNTDRRHIQGSGSRSQLTFYRDRYLTKRMELHKKEDTNFFVKMRIESSMLNHRVISTTDYKEVTLRITQGNATIYRVRHSLSNAQCDMLEKEGVLVLPVVLDQEQVPSEVQENSSDVDSRLLKIEVLLEDRGELPIATGTLLKALSSAEEEVPVYSQEEIQMVYQDEFQDDELKEVVIEALLKKRNINIDAFRWWYRERSSESQEEGYQRYYAMVMYKCPIDNRCREAAVEYRKSQDRTQKADREVPYVKLLTDCEIIVACN